MAKNEWKTEEPGSDAYSQVLLSVLSVLLTSLLLLPADALHQLARGAASFSPTAEHVLENWARGARRTDWPPQVVFGRFRSAFQHWRNQDRGMDGAMDELEIAGELENHSSELSNSVDDEGFLPAPSTRKINEPGTANASVHGLEAFPGEFLGSALNPPRSQSPPATGTHKPASTNRSLVATRKPLLSTLVDLHDRKSDPVSSRSTSSTILAIGDSMLKSGLGLALRHSFASEGHKVEIYARSATGLARPDFFDWPAQASHLISGRKFAAIFVFLGTNDAQSFEDETGTYRFGTPEWAEIYSSRIKNLNATLCQATPLVYWFSLPPMSSRRFNSRINRMNDIVETSMAGCARTVSTLRDAMAPDGLFQAYQRVDKSSVRIRDLDGIHVSAEGAGLVASALKSDLSFLMETE